MTEEEYAALTFSERRALGLKCGKCGEFTGNNTQGHLWGFCSVTRTVREFHYCCPEKCELEAAK